MHHSERNNIFKEKSQTAQSEELFASPHGTIQNGLQIQIRSDQEEFPARIVQITSDQVQTQDQTITGNPATQHWFRSGSFRQGFGFKSAYYPFERPRSVTTRHRDYVMVDFIFYSRCFSEKYSKIVENNLKLLSRLNLYTEKA